MTDPDVPHVEMPSFPWPDRRDASWTEDASVTALLAGTELPAGAAAELEAVAGVLAALRAQPGGDEMAGEAAAIAAFRDRFSVPASSPRRSHRRRPILRTSPLGAKVAAAAAIAVVSLGAAATTAAFAGALPDALQQFAHRTIGAPAVHRGAPTAERHSKPTAGHLAGRAAQAGPKALGHAAFGLCTAYEHATAHGRAAHKAVAFRRLVRIAGGAQKVQAFCAAVRHPGSRASAHAARAAHRVPPKARHAHPGRRPTGPPTRYHTMPPTAHQQA